MKRKLKHIMSTYLLGTSCVHKPIRVAYAEYVNKKRIKSIAWFCTHSSDLAHVANLVTLKTLMKQQTVLRRDVARF